MEKPLIPATVQLLCRNGMPAIETCLASLTRFDEVIVQDGNSTDGTRETALRFPNVRILDQDKNLLNAEGRITDFSAMRNQSIAAAKYDWLLVVDADEAALPEMVDEVAEIVAKNVPGVYKAFRRFVVDGEPVMHCAGYPAYQIRLFHRSCVDGYQKPVHEKLAVHPNCPVQILRTELPVPMPPAKSLDAKYRRYLDMEVKKLGVMPWGRWLRWVFYRNLRSAVGVMVLSSLIWLTPKKGKRMPMIYDWQAARQSLQTIYYTFPPLAKRRAAKA
jgi:glycosyltransferase involved in cell wall biosynthesis